MRAIVFGPTIVDMGWGRAAANILYALRGISTFELTADIAIGLVAGTFGLLVIIQALSEIAKQ